MRINKLLIICWVTVFSADLRAEGTASWWDGWKSDLANTWNSDKYTIVLPVHTYHSRATYDDEHISKYNETPWGAGVERFYIDNLKNRHSFYAIVFKDSWNDFEPMIGYIWQKNWYPAGNDDLRIGLGYNALVTARERTGSYMPFPGIMPMFALEYKRFAVQAGWVPYGGRNTGDVIFTMIKWEI